jgi:hypothetical protein
VKAREREYRAMWARANHLTNELEREPTSAELDEVDRLLSKWT